MRASTGWLKNFKLQIGIRELNIEGEILSGDFSAGQSFRTKFNFIEKKGYSESVSIMPMKQAHFENIFQENY